MSDMNGQLSALYREAMESMAQLPKDRDGVSGPHLISVPETYEQCRVKLLVVGQQTCGWGGVSDGVGGLMELYREFDLGREYHSTPFWTEAHRIHDALNPEGPPGSFLWTNLVKIDVHGDRPDPDFESAISASALLPSEIRITSPDAVIFFTGPNYDDRLEETFPGVEYRDLSPMVSVVHHAGLPPRTFRTYHPNHLWHSRHREAIDEVIGAIARP